MPEITAVDEPNRFAVLDVVRQHQDFGIARHGVVSVQLVFERAEAARKGKLPRRRKVLISNRDHLISMKRVANAAKHVIRKGVEIDAQDFGAHGPAKLSQLHCRI